MDAAKAAAAIVSSTRRASDAAAFNKTLHGAHAQIDAAAARGAERRRVRVQRGIAVADKQIRAARERVAELAGLGAPAAGDAVIGVLIDAAGAKARAAEAALASVRASASEGSPGGAGAGTVEVLMAVSKLQFAAAAAAEAAEMASTAAHARTASSAGAAAVTSAGESVATLAGARRMASAARTALAAIVRSLLETAESPPTASAGALAGAMLRSETAEVAQREVAAAVRLVDAAEGARSAVVGSGEVLLPLYEGVSEWSAPAAAVSAVRSAALSTAAASAVATFVAAVARAAASVQAAHEAVSRLDTERVRVGEAMAADASAADAERRAAENTERQLVSMQQVLAERQVVEHEQRLLRERDEHRKDSHPRRQQHATGTQAGGDPAATQTGDGGVDRALLTLPAAVRGLAASWSDGRVPAPAAVRGDLMAGVPAHHRSRHVAVMASLGTEASERALQAGWSFQKERTSPSVSDVGIATCGTPADARVGGLAAERPESGGGEVRVRLFAEAVPRGSPDLVRATPRQLRLSSRQSGGRMSTSPHRSGRDTPPLSRSRSPTRQERHPSVPVQQVGGRTSTSPHRSGRDTPPLSRSRSVERREARGVHRHRSTSGSTREDARGGRSRARSARSDGSAASPSSASEAGSGRRHVRVRESPASARARAAGSPGVHRRQLEARGHVSSHALAHSGARLRRPHLLGESVAGHSADESDGGRRRVQGGAHLVAGALPGVLAGGAHRSDSGSCSDGFRRSRRVVFATDPGGLPAATAPVKWGSPSASATAGEKGASKGSVRTSSATSGRTSAVASGRHSRSGRPLSRRHNGVQSRQHNLPVRGNRLFGYERAAVLRCCGTGAYIS